MRLSNVSSSDAALVSTYIYHGWCSWRWKTLDTSGNKHKMIGRSPTSPPPPRQERASPKQDWIFVLTSGKAGDTVPTNLLHSPSPWLGSLGWEKK